MRFLPLTSWMILLLAASALADSGPTNTVETLADPFRLDSVLATTLNDTESAEKTSRALTFQYLYGFESGVVVGVTLPILFFDTPPAYAGETLPRLGGASNDRLELNGYFRFYGNPSDYLGFELSLGFPFQTSDALNNTSVNTWIVPAALLGRLTEGPFALHGSLTDTFNGPEIVPSSVGDNYTEEMNSLNLSAYFSVFPATSFSPYLRWSEGWPVQKITGTDGGGTSLLTKYSTNQRSRTFGIGFDSVPFDAPVMLSLEVDYKDLPSPGAQTPWSMIGKCRWAF